MYTEVKGGAYTGGSDVPADKKARVDDLILQFEAQLQSFVTDRRIPARHIRPLAPGSVMCGAVAVGGQVSAVAHP